MNHDQSAFLARTLQLAEYDMRLRQHGAGRWQDSNAKHTGHHGEHTGDLASLVAQRHGLVEEITFAVP